MTIIFLVVKELGSFLVIFGCLVGTKSMDSERYRPKK